MTMKSVNVYFQTTSSVCLRVLMAQLTRSIVCELQTCLHSTVESFDCCLS